MGFFFNIFFQQPRLFDYIICTTDTSNHCSSKITSNCGLLGPQFPQGQIHTFLVFSVLDISGALLPWDYYGPLLLSVHHCSVRLVSHHQFVNIWNSHRSVFQFDHGRPQLLLILYSAEPVGAAKKNKTKIFTLSVCYIIIISILATLM